MKPYNKPIVSRILITIILFSFILLAGCAGQTVQKAEMTPEQQFEMSMNRLIENVVSLNTNTSM